MIPVITSGPRHVSGGDTETAPPKTPTKPSDPDTITPKKPDRCSPDQGDGGDDGDFGTCRLPRA